MVDKKVTIIGLGLIGGSLARALKERVGITDITAINRSSRSIDAALKDRTISRGSSELNQHVYDSDIIFICTPVRRAIEYIELLKEKIKPDCILTDVGSTKSEIISYINKMDNPPLFIGGHPMAGSENTGYEAGFTHLFENAFYVLTPSKTTTDYSMNLMTGIVEKIGAIPVKIRADEHDKATGCISHVPHIIASTLVNMVRFMDSEDGKMKLLAAGGFKDITRIASSSPEMWENIVLSNKEQIGGILDFYVEILKKFKTSMENDDSQAILEFFKSAKDYRDTFSSHKRGLFTPEYDILVDIIDEPGILGEIATLLGHNKINIKNMNVLNNREFQQGCLKVTLPDPESLDVAHKVLIENGYKATCI
ncbi:prephenate dehydrogenase [Pseudobacteroides cellulosolvens]|uniref:Prephenate dehydrogenase n=1 Tax=Pseudobacteroides cellulosolvens ATCC 35603 = DSM 2933 TaxID=398512 RepID=A0A0L6JQ21_9FIRM|nr:prephenate dehydrogenase [Pseudobacteroides cellulosolvens]KNY27477.1 Prephenate dehydrogenase [Pseudobacteroides cellulosolvens ATCC 35603 = DSM 2933]